MLHTSVSVCQNYTYDHITTAMDRHTEAVDVYSVFKPVFLVSKVLGLSPYNAVGDIGSGRIIVTVSAIIHSIGMFILNAGLFAYGLVPAMCVLHYLLTSPVCLGAGRQRDSLKS